MALRAPAAAWDGSGACSRPLAAGVECGHPGRPPATGRERRPARAGGPERRTAIVEDYGGNRALSRTAAGTRQRTIDGQRTRSHQHGAVLRFREHRARRARRQVREVRHRQGARAPAAQGQHRRQEGVLRLGPLQGVQGADARGVVRADRDPARAAVGQELGRHPDGRRRARPLLHQGARRHLRHHQRRLGLLAARLQAAREQQGRDRRRRQELDVRPADRQLRRVHLLRRPRAREEEGGAAPRAAKAAAARQGAGGGRGRSGGAPTAQSPSGTPRRSAAPAPEKANATSSASRRRSTSSSRRSRRWSPSAATTRRSGARWSSRR